MDELSKKNTKSFTPQEHSGDNRIIIYGAGVYGEIAIAALDWWGLKADYICDQSLSNGSKYMNIDCIEISDIARMCDVEVILASYNYVGEMIKKCEEYNIQNVFDMYEMLKLPLEEYDLSGRAKGRLKDIPGYLQMLENLSEDKLNVNHLEFIVTERCSFKCRGCANLIPEYTNPVDVSSDSIIKVFNTCCDCFDHIGEIYLLGGEPFLNDSLDEIISYIGQHGFKDKISIFTNGTIIPSQKVLEALSSMGVLIHISDYDNSKQQLKELSKILSEYKINHVVKKYDTWIDLNVSEDRDEVDIQVGYDNCFFRKNYTIHRGKLFVCPRAANAYAQGKMIDGDRLYINLEEENAKEKIKSFLNDARYTDMCTKCAGGNLKGYTIRAGVQMNESN